MLRYKYMTGLCIILHALPCPTRVGFADPRQQHEFHTLNVAADPLALIDRNFQGFGKELFTDAGKYVIHFGDKPEEAAEQAANIVKAAHPDKPAPPVTAVAKYRNPRLQVIATSTADQLVCCKTTMVHG